MALTLGDNFSYQGAKPLDARLKYDTLADMKAVGDATMYDGCMAYCSATDKTYQWKSTNSVDASTGRWREFSSGGGETIDYPDLTNKPQINSVTLTGNKTYSDLDLQRNMQLTGTTGPAASLVGRVYQYLGENTAAYHTTFTHGHFYEVYYDSSTHETGWREVNVGSGASYTAGDGIDISNNVISTKQSESGDIDEIIDVYPTAGELVSIVNAFNRGDIYSTDEKMIGQWTSGKPLYQKTVSFGTLPNNTTKNVDINVSNIEKIVSCKGIAISSSSVLELPHVTTGDSKYFIEMYFSTSKVYISTKYDYSSYAETYVTIQYTKTTDTAISIGSENEYSTTEKVVGTWLDGEPIFQKTIETTTPTCTSQGAQAEKYVEIGEEVERFISVEGFFRIPNTADMPLNSVFKANSTITYSLVRGNPNIATNNPNTIYISVSNTNWSDRTCYVTFQYTKATT